ncbi:hypothetical protein FSOLCH5_005364 [Fusarium solani]
MASVANSASARLTSTESGSQDASAPKTPISTTSIVSKIPRPVYHSCRSRLEPPS